MTEPLLVVMAGLPGTGKTTLATHLVATLRAANLRIDAIETAIVKCGLAEPPVGPVGYVVAHEIAAATLRGGVPVVADAVNPVPEAREGWRQLSLRTQCRLLVFETVISDRDEHERRVAARTPDLPGLVVPTWEQVQAREYVPWDEERDGPRHVVDMTDSAAGIRAATEIVRR